MFKFEFIWIYINVLNLYRLYIYNMCFSYTSLPVVTDILIFLTKHGSRTGEISAHDLFRTQAPCLLCSIHAVHTKG